MHIRPDITCCRRPALRTILILSFVLQAAGGGLASGTVTQTAGFSKLVKWMAAETHEEPLMALGDAEEAFSRSAHRSNLDYMQNAPDFIDAVKAELETHQLTWELIDSRRRLLAVPETRPAFAELFETYCREVVDYVTAATGFQNPYEAILTLDGEFSPDPSDAPGIKVLLVHNLAEEFIYTYAFRGSGPGSIRVELSQTLFTGELGAYTSSLIFRPDGSFEFLPSPMTVWQNAAGNPYSVLMVPMEETLHIWLRSATEEAIGAECGRSGNAVGDPAHIVEEWAAVEEAIVGGVVNRLLPAFLERHLEVFQRSWVKDDLTAKKQINRYRYLRQGIRVVKQMGVKAALRVYQKSPKEFRDLLKPLDLR